MFVFKNSNTKFEMFNKILFTVVLSIFITILVLSSILHVSFEKQELSTILSASKDTLSQVSYTSTLMTDLAKTMAMQIYFDEDLSRLLTYSSLTMQEQLNYLRRLQSFKVTNPHIHSIYIYNGITDVFYTSEDLNYFNNADIFYDKDIKNIIHNFDDYKILTPIPRKILTRSSGLEKNYTNVFTFIFNDTQNIAKLKNAVIVNISEEWLEKTIYAMDSLPESHTIIIDQDGHLLTNNNNEQALHILSKNNCLKKIINSGKKSDSFTETINDNKLLITYLSTESTGWIFVKITPYKIVLNKITELRKRTIISALIILIIGILTSLFLSRKLYKPFSSILREFDILKTKVLHDYEYLKQKHILDMLRNNTEANHNISKSFKLLDTKIETSQKVFLVELNIDAYSDFCKQFSSDDRSTMKFGILNIATEIFSEKYICEPVDTEGGELFLLLNTSSQSTSEWKEIVTTLANRVQTNLKYYFNLSISIYVSTTDNSIEDIHKLYNQILNTSRYRLYYGHQCLIFAEDINLLPSDAYIYPIDKEKKLVDSIKLHKLDAANSIFLEIIDNLMMFSDVIFYMSITRLATSITMIIESIQKNVNIAFNYNLHMFLTNIYSIETVNEINEKFAMLFETVINALIENCKNVEHTDRINKVFDIIRKDYSDPNLSLESIADELEMSYSYLGKMFKKHNSYSVGDYINNIRIQKSMELLKNTDKPINEIAQMSGFISVNYFYTLFKRINGITPTTYRKNGYCSRPLNRSKKG